MKGLLIKDYKLIMHNGKLFFILMAVWFLALRNYDGYSFLIGYSTMIFVLLVQNTMSLDEYYKSIPFLMTLPIKRNTYVAEKYALMLGFSLIGTVLSTFLCILLHRELFQQLLIESLAIYVALTLFQFLMLPIQLKFGGDKGRIVLVGLLACVTVIATSMSGILPRLFHIQDDIGTMWAVMWFVSLPAGTITLILILALAICFAASYCISLHIMQKKEF